MKTTVDEQCGSHRQCGGHEQPRNGVGREACGDCSVAQRHIEACAMDVAMTTIPTMLIVARHMVFPKDGLAYEPPDYKLWLDVAASAMCFVTIVILVNVSFSDGLSFTQSRRCGVWSSCDPAHGQMKSRSRRNGKATSSPFALASAESEQRCPIPHLPDRRAVRTEMRCIVHHRQLPD